MQHGRVRRASREREGFGSGAWISLCRRQSNVCLDPRGIREQLAIERLVRVLHHVVADCLGLEE